MATAKLAVALPIFEKLGPNRVTHPIEICERYQEGYVSTISSPQPILPHASISKQPQHTQLNQHTQADAEAYSLMTQLMLWKHPASSLLSRERILEETRKFKDDLIKTATHFDSKIYKAHGIDSATVIDAVMKDKHTDALFEFLGCLWGCLFVTDTAICGVEETQCYDVSTGFTSITSVNLEEVRGRIISSKAQNLKTVKDYKDLFISMKLPLNTIDTESNKRRPLLKAELAHIVSSYINSYKEKTAH